MDRSAECKCPCHTGGAKHVMMCGCYLGRPITDDPLEDCSCTEHHRDPQCIVHGPPVQNFDTLSAYRNIKTQNDCIFCKIANGDMLVPIEPLFSNGGAILIRDKNPLAPSHALV